MPTRSGSSCGESDVLLGGGLASGVAVDAWVVSGRGLVVGRVPAGVEDGVVESAAVTVGPVVEGLMEAVAVEILA